MLRAENLYPTIARAWAADAGITGKTRTQYLSILELFHRRVTPKRFAEITAADVRQFITIKEDGGVRADRSQRKYLQIIATVFDWALDPEIRLVEANPAARLRTQQRANRRPPRAVNRKTWLGEERALRLVARIRAGGTPLDRRDAFMVGLYLTTGFRLTELLSLRWGDVDLAAGTLHVLGKGSKDATVALTAPARKLLVGWRTELVAATSHDDIEEWPVVPAIQVLPKGFRKGPAPDPRIVWERRLRSPSAVWRIVTARAEEAGITHLAPHDLRRSFAGILADRDIPLEDIRRAMRHTSESTTRIYLEDRPKPMSGLDDLDYG